MSIELLIKMPSVKDSVQFNSEQSTLDSIATANRWQQKRKTHELNLNIYDMCKNAHTN